MKEWNAPSIEELNVTETAGGIFQADFETVVLFNKKGNDNPTTTPQPEKPENSGNSDGLVDSLS